MWKEYVGKKVTILFRRKEDSENESGVLKNADSSGMWVDTEEWGIIFYPFQSIKWVQVMDT